MPEETPARPAAATLAKTFDPAAIEARWYAHWEANGRFRPHRPDAAPFTIVNPPPNVTGSLHVGHALDNTLQDIVVRHQRLRGKDALWVVGTDHAGIATQMVVERRLEERQDKRTNYTREGFVDKVWEWKAESGGAITGQLRRLGCSMDWSREQFTMSPEFSRAVTKVFVDLYRQGLIYRDKRLVNWDSKLGTAISDLEVEQREVKGHFWHVRYPLADGERLNDGRDHIVVATTRPETMLADMAVAVNPADDRYRRVIGKAVVLPITGRRIPIVADEHADPELGSGAVKITPGHDFNDFDVGRRAGIAAAAMLNMFDAKARVAQTADGLVPAELIGLAREDARRVVVARLEAAGALADVEDRLIQVPHGDRSGAVIEPWLTDQWYVDAAKLAEAPLRAVRDGRIEIVPRSWEKTFFHWLENIQPWCISRQLWWGHRLPAWYGPQKTNDGMVITHDQALGGYAPTFVASSFQEAAKQASDWYSVPLSAVWESENSWSAVMGRRGVRPYNELLDNMTRAEYIEAVRREAGDDIPLWRDQDVLDTWFSSALWPFATLGWPDVSSPSPDGEGDHAQHGGGVSFASHDASSSKNTPPPASLVPLPGEAGEDTTLLARHYPNDLLISGFDILFFWDARMAMMGMHQMGRERSDPDKIVPWRRLYLHGLVRAADGQKMSKSKGNVVDPLGLIDRYGADALRFFMAAMESQGRDVKMDERRVEGYRNFATKLWNAARFCQANGIGASATLAAPAATLAVNTWIVGEVVETLAALDQALADLRFDAAANAIYHLVWDTFCDWYLELIKPVLSGGLSSPRSGEGDDAQHGGGVSSAPQAAPGSRQTPPPSQLKAGTVPLPAGAGEETRRVAGWVLDQMLVMLHPFMPFVTEELWHALGERERDLIVSTWPEPEAVYDVVAAAEIQWLIRLVSAIRRARTDLHVPPGARLAFGAVDADMMTRQRLDAYATTVGRLARVDLRPGASGEAQVIVDNVTYVLALGDVIDLAAEKARLGKAREASAKERDTLANRLANPAFIDKAKPEAVAKARADHAAHAAEAERLETALARLG